MAAEMPYRNLILVIKIVCWRSSIFQPIALQREVIHAILVRACRFLCESNSRIQAMLFQLYHIKFDDYMNFKEQL